MLSEFWKYPKWCPKCKAWYRAVWKECTVCKIPLVSSLWQLPARIFRALFLFVFLAALLVAGTCLTQRSGRDLYVQSYEYLKARRYEDSWNAFCKAFGYNQTVRWIRSAAEGITEAVQGLLPPKK